MPSRRTPQRPPPPAPAEDWALFLDVDGCLLDLAGAPDAVVMPRKLPAVLTALSQRLDGAVALISGRALENVERLFVPLQLPIAGLHGLERRSAAGVAPMLPMPPTWDVVREAAASVVASHPGTLLEDKGVALALHWRNAPRAAGELLAFAEATLPRLPGYRLQHGDHVVELRPATGDKGTAIVALLDEPPFRGRMPVFAGDDVTDEAGFAVVNARAGLSVVVGKREPTCAHYALRDPTAVRAWLAGQHP
ncbi:trehalose-phosphatase [Cognatiluteimonas profundi]|uniref:trehalose-phosphatase n=1 Tax=Cognatiluteimonas profundi TaxID=2594501 RepID=UPI00131B2068|nr:trehalose-phosphatase [Lysobacter profundi]